MTNHDCPHCGYETRRPRRGRADRHPAAAVTAGLFTVTLTSMMLTVHPIAAVSLIAATGVGAVVWLIDRERDRRVATAARADYEYHAMMLAPLPSLPFPARPRRAHPHNATPWQRVSLLRTEPLRPARN